MLDESVNEQPQGEDPIGITKEQWMIILEDPDLVKEKDIELLKLIFSCKNYEARSSHLAQLLNAPNHGAINFQVARLGKRIAEKLNIQVPVRPHSHVPMWWSVPFRGRNEGRGRFCYILKPELKEAMQEIYG